MTEQTTTGDRLDTGLGLIIRVVKPWRFAKRPRTPDAHFTLTSGKSSLSVFPVKTDAVDDKAVWTSRWQSAGQIPLTLDGDFFYERTELPRGLTLVSVRSARWTPAFLWLMPKSAGWTLRVDTAGERIDADRAVFLELIEQFELPAAS